MTTKSDRQPDRSPNNDSDAPPSNRKNRWSVAEKIIDKLTGRQLFVIILAIILAYCVLNWSN